MQEIGQKQQGNYHRLALLACQLGTKCCMADCLLFEKENDFCMTFFIGHWPANIHIGSQTAHNLHRK